MFNMYTENTAMTPNIQPTSYNLLLGRESFVLFEGEIANSSGQGQITIDPVAFNPASSVTYSHLLI